MRPIDIILVIAVVVLALGEVFIIGNMDAYSTSAPRAASVTESTVPSPTIPSNILTPVGGTVEQVSGDSIVLRGVGGQTIELHVDTRTTIVKQGAPKDSAAHEIDMDAFRTHSRELAKDPEKNHDALATLIAPSRYAETTIMLSDITVGDAINAYTIRRGGLVQAVRVVVSDPHSSRN
jgi:hypothetical protein